MRLCARELRRRLQVRRHMAKRPFAVLYAPPKTGGTAVTRTLEAAGITTHHVHTLRSDCLGEMVRECRDLGKVPSPNIWRSKYLIAHPPTSEDPWRIITTIREPIARVVSFHFHRLRLTGATEHPTVADFAALDTDWFDDEFRVTLGIDVYAEPFDAERGWQIYTGSTAEVLVIRQESLAVGPVADFIGVPLGEMALANVTADKAKLGTSYGRYLGTATIEAKIAERIYESRFARHFYTAEEREAFCHRWTAPGAARSTWAVADGGGDPAGAGRSSKRDASHDR